MPRKTLSPDAAYKAGSGLFLLIAFFFIGVAVYEYDLWTKFEAQVAAAEARTQASGVAEEFAGPWSLYAPLYLYGGDKWNVVGINVMLAILCMAISAALFWKWRSRHADEEMDDSEPPVA